MNELTIDIFGRNVGDLLMQRKEANIILMTTSSSYSEPKFGSINFFKFIVCRIGFAYKYNVMIKINQSK